MFQPNFNISQALAALAPPTPPAETTTPTLAPPPPAETTTPTLAPPPPAETTTPSHETTTPTPAQTPAIPPASEATSASAPITETVDEVNPNAVVGGERGGEDEGAGVASEFVEEKLALTDAEGVERVRSRMASVDVEEPTDAGRIEEVMAGIEAEMRDGRTMTVEGVERVETGVGRIETREKEGEVIFDVYDSEEEELQQVMETEAQILSASRLRRNFLLEESEEEIEPPRVVVEVQAGGASRRKRKVLAEEPEEEEEDEDEVVLRPQPEVPRQVEQIAQPAPAAELERK